MLIDTGAGGGNYVSLAFWKSVQSWGGKAVARKLSSRGKGVLLVANPDNSGVPGMQILGSTVLPIVFPPEDRVRNILVRVVQDLPYGFIFRIKFLSGEPQRHSSREGEGLPTVARGTMVAVPEAHKRSVLRGAAPRHRPILAPRG